AFYDERIAVDRYLHAATTEASCNCRETVALLDAQLGEPAHHRAASGARSGNGKNRILVDHPRRSLCRDVRAPQCPGTAAQVGHRLSPLVTLVQQDNVCAHLAQTLEEARARRVDADPLDRDF